VKIICDFEIQLVVGNEELTSLFCKFILKINVNYLFSPRCFITIVFGNRKDLGDSSSGGRIS
jgi:hypothetical protein